MKYFKYFSAASSLQTDSITEPLDTGDFIPDPQRIVSSLTNTTLTETVQRMATLRKIEISRFQACNFGISSLSDDNEKMTY